MVIDCPDLFDDFMNYWNLIIGYFDIYSFGNLNRSSNKFKNNWENCIELLRISMKKMYMLLNCVEFNFNPSNPTQQTKADAHWHQTRKQLLN